MTQKFSFLAELFGLFLAFCLYFTGIESVTSYIQEKHLHFQKNIFYVHLTLTILYLVCCAMVIHLFLTAGGNLIFLYMCMIFAILGIGIGFLVLFYLYRNNIRRISLLFFSVWTLIILIGTVFARIGYTDTSFVIILFHGFKKAIAYHDITYLRHFFLNIVLFIPFGLFISALYPHKTKHLFYACIGAWALSTTIEWIQLVLSIGQADLDDVVANTIGSIIGWGIFNFYWKIHKVHRYKTKYKFAKKQK